MKINEVIKEGRNVINNSLAVNIILAYILGKNKEYLISHSEEILENSKFEQFISLINRHQRGEPISYITGKKEFFGLEFFVNKDVLIPRPETEHLVEKIIDLVNQEFKNKQVKILDVGTGSGNIAVSLALNIKNYQITAADISEKALEVAQINIRNHFLTDKIKLIQSDLLGNVTGQFDIIVANLPYIGKVENNYIAFEVENFEPQIALFGGNHGLELYEKLFMQIKEKNCINSYLLGEIGFSQKEKLEQLIKKYFSNSEYQIFQDLAGFDRYFVVNLQYAG